jgi:hypothetical protein
LGVGCCRCSHRKVDLTLPTGALPYEPPPAEEGQVKRLPRDGALDVLKVRRSSRAAAPRVLARGGCAATLFVLARGALTNRQSMLPAQHACTACPKSLPRWRDAERCL